ncbi:Histone H4 transcription factor [Nymphon striatum]|nr:Histone H4 transcription factor [Nymphon striatum]
MAKRIYYKDEQLCLRCEWEECPVKSDSVDDFLNHISNHVKNVSPEDASCLWCGCQYNPDEVEADPVLQLLSHVLFHGFHTKIKCYGANMLKRDKVGECELDRSGCNVVPELPIILQCGWKDCTSAFKNPEYFYRHVNDHANQSKDTIDKTKLEHRLECLWQGCNDRKFNEPEKLRNHLRSHSQEKLIACPTCGSLFTNRTKLYDHIKRQTIPKEGGFICTSCDKSFVSERLLKAHSRNHVYRYSCPLCKFFATSYGNLESHLRFRHSDVRTFKCKECPKSYKSLQSLKLHEEVHLPVRCFKCSEEDCDYSTGSYSKLVRHYRISHWTRQTEIVEMNSVEILSKHDEKRVHICAKYKAPYSDGGAQSINSGLIGRKSMDVGESDIKRLRSYHISNMNRDARLSKGYQCHLCSKVYARGQNLTTHLYSVHKYQPPAANRLRYRLCKDGFHRLVQVQYEEGVSTSHHVDNAVVTKEHEIFEDCRSVDNMANPVSTNDERNVLYFNASDTSSSLNSENKTVALENSVDINDTCAMNSNNNTEIYPVVLVPSNISSSQNVVVKVIQPDGSSILYPIQIPGKPSSSKDIT